MHELQVRKATKSEIEGALAKTVADSRLIERGIVCGTKNKKDLLQIIASLGISVSKINKSDIRIRKLCDIIRNKLIESEVKERAKDTRYKYLYGWWDENTQVHI